MQCVSLKLSKMIITIVQFRAPDDEWCAARNMFSLQ